jgi:hypothetical protein
VFQIASGLLVAACALRKKGKRRSGTRVLFMMRCLRCDVVYRGGHPSYIWRERAALAIYKGIASCAACCCEYRTSPRPNIKHR